MFVEIKNMLENITLFAHAIEFLKQRINFNAKFTMPRVGDYKFSAQTTDLNGWLLCDGRALDIADYPGLYEVIGTTFGNNGAGTFRLPNLRGRVPAAIGQSVGTNHTLGQSLGEEEHTLTINEMPTHNHGVTDPSHSHNITDPGHIHTGDRYPGGVQSTDNAFGTESAAQEWMTTGSVNSSTTGITINNATTGISINNTGGSQAHNNMQPTTYIGSMFIFAGAHRL